MLNRSGTVQPNGSALVRPPPTGASIGKIATVSSQGRIFMGLPLFGVDGHRFIILSITVEGTLIVTPLNCTTLTACVALMAAPQTLVQMATAQTADTPAAASRIEAAWASFGAASTRSSTTRPNQGSPGVDLSWAPAASTVTATVDRDGRVVTTPAAGSIQRTGENTMPPADGSATGAESPCPAVPALPAADARQLIEATAREERFAVDLALAVAKTESAFVSNILSPRGAYGLMQLMPATARSYGVNICDPKDNVRGGIAFLRELTERYGNPFYVLAAYNAGEPRLLRHRGVPPIGETVTYIARVLNEWHGWKPPGERRGGSAAEAPASEMQASRTGRTAGRGSTQAAGREAANWQGGFVHHFD